MTLPSNSSMDYYENNTATEFTTKLVQTIELDGAWEVGLSSISMPTKVENVLKDECYFYLYIDDTKSKVTLEAGQYDVIDDVISGLSHNQPRVARFGYDARANRVNMWIWSDLRSRAKIEFSIGLAHLLGFRPNFKYAQIDNTRLLAEKPFDLDGTAHMVYVYCDLVEPLLVGDTKVPLLRVLNKTNKMNYIFNPVQFVPIQKKCFDTIEIKLTTSTGDVVPFLPGKSILVLEFRRRAHDYFTI